MPRRVFSVDEVNALLPLLDGVLRGLEAGREEIRRRHDQLLILDALWGEKLVEPSNPDHAELREHRDAIEAAAREIQRTVEDEITGRGIRFPQGGLEHGLLDFPTLWEGRWVYLCWQRGEPEVRAWHEVHAGYAGRQEITPEQRRRMGREGAAGS